MGDYPADAVRQAIADAIADAELRAWRKALSDVGVPAQYARAVIAAARAIEAKWGDDDV